MQSPHDKFKEKRRKIAKKQRDRQREIRELYPRKPTIRESFVRILENNKVGEFTTQDAIEIYQSLKTTPTNFSTDRKTIYSMILYPLRDMYIIRSLGFGYWEFMGTKHLGDAPISYQNLNRKVGLELDLTIEDTPQITHQTTKVGKYYNKDGSPTPLGSQYLSLSDDDYDKLHEDIRREIEEEYFSLKMGN